MGTDSDTLHDRLVDVDLNDADRARIDYLSRGNASLSEAEAERIVRFAKVPRDERSPAMLRSNGRHPDSKPHDDAHDADGEDATNGSGGKTRRMCGDVRRRMRAADTPVDVIDAYPDKHPSTIFLHAEGRCDCYDVDVEPTTSPRVKAPECKRMRSAFRAGATKRDVMADFYRSANAVNKHLFGRCDHKTRRESPLYDRVSATECGHLREAYRRNESVSVHDLAASYGISSSIAHKHLRDKCEHDVDVDPIPPQEITAETCSGMRRDYKRDPRAVVAKIARNHDTTRPTADYHIFGRCACDADEDPAVRR